MLLNVLGAVKAAEMDLRGAACSACDGDLQAARNNLHQAGRHVIEAIDYVSRLEDELKR